MTGDDLGAYFVQTAKPLQPYAPRRAAATLSDSPKLAESIPSGYSPLAAPVIHNHMIISYKHNFIFVRTRKTASSTIETVLKDNLGPNDVFVGKKRLLSGEHRSEAAIQPSGVAGHMKVQEIKSLVSPEFWRDCFKFSCERHPYEKAVSLAHYNYARGLKRERQRESDFSEYLDKIVKTGSYRGFDHYTIDGKVVVDDFIRFESLMDDLQRIGSKLGMSIPEELPRRKGSHRTDKRPAAEILTEAQKGMVFEHCKEEFALFGYSR